MIKDTNNKYKLCPYHQDSLSWDTCSDDFEGCEVDEARRQELAKRSIEPLDPFCLEGLPNGPIA